MTMIKLPRASEKGPGLSGKYLGLPFYPEARVFTSSFLAGSGYVEEYTPATDLEDADVC